MLFTPEQEQKLIEDNMPKIYRAVDNFTSRYTDNATRVPYDDMVQEVMLAFLLYARKCKTKEEVDRFPWFTANGAMRDLALAYQPMSCPHTSHHRFSEIVSKMPRTISIDALNASTGLDIDGMTKHWVDDKDTQIDFDIFMENQAENTRRIAAMRVYGMKVKEIATQCGVSKVIIHRRINKLNEEYRKYCEGDENEE